MTASDADLAALEQAAQPVYAELERDETTKALIEQIREVKQRLPAPAPVRPCAPATANAPNAGEATDTEPADDAAFPEGVYRMKITAESMMKLGVSHDDARDHGGMWTLTFQDGQVTIADVRASDDRHSTGTGIYCVAADRVSLELGGDTTVCGDSVLFSATWTMHDDQLRFAEIRDGEGVSIELFDALWGSQPWEKIG